ncbi:MAG: orotidine-5'-phosphate decarboxylase [Rhodobacteraceae bacterium]|nr:orotidine-5'-phosphate decarboxylase [Paracoccaceae bacterium]
MTAESGLPEADDRLIVALDFPTGKDALFLVDRLDGLVSFYKVGLGMLAGGGLELVQELMARGKHVFLDLKLFDIGATVEMAASGLGGLGPTFLTVHGDPHVVSAAVAGRADTGTKILAVTILTSVDRGDLDNCLIRSGSLEGLVVERARLAIEAGADGVIASPLEARLLRERIPEPQFLIVTPGIRLEGGAVDDQKRIATPGAALRAGASHVVVGRQITRSGNPVDAVRRVLEDVRDR